MADLIYTVAPWVAAAIVAANWRQIVWLARVLAGVQTDGGESRA